MNTILFYRTRAAANGQSKGVKEQNLKTKSNNLSSICLLSFIFFLFSLIAFSQAKLQDNTKVNQLDEVLVSAVRVTNKTPMSFSDVSKEELAQRNLAQDIPILLNYLPSVVTTSDAGNGVGYTGIRVRGSDATRVNVTINGIPYNDSESQGTFWVNMPDFASSVESIQLQRGVGTSTNGAGAFGASLNMLTDSYSQKSSGEIANSFGSFNTRKNTVKFSTGLINEHFEIAGRLSTLKSDGYIDRASSDLKSYFMQGTYVGETTLIKALVFGGLERTYQSWNGVDATTLATNRTYNSVGEKFDNDGIFEGFYDNQVDNYNQDHYQLHWNEKISDNWFTNLAFHYTKGKGYYEEFVDDWKYKNVFFTDDSNFSFLGLDPINVDGQAINSTDYTRRKWLDNDFYGTTFSTNYKTRKTEFIFGGGLNKYDGNHFDQILWAQYPSNSQTGDIYDASFATKTDGNIFAKINHELTNTLSIYGDLQIRNVHYKSNELATGLANDNFNFFNPKAGLNFALDTKNKLYFSYARANREPSRSDYANENPKPETLNDFELGWRFKSTNYLLNVNGYYMAYKDQLVLTGELDNVGNPTRKNSGDSYRLGLEVDAYFKLSAKWNLQPNFTISNNKNVNFISKVNDVLIPMGATDIAYSPGFIAGNILNYSPLVALKLSILSKFVSEQYLNNIEDASGKLNDYFVNDFSASYQIYSKSVFDSITITVLANNILNADYSSNGIDYGGGFVYYYPQAGANFLAGINLKF